MEKNFIAVLMSGETDEFWFKTKDEAWEFIYSRSCDDCKKNRHFDACSAEWDVWTRDEWNEMLTDDD